MTLTEEEAKKKWCPHARVTWANVVQRDSGPGWVTTGDHSFNRANIECSSDEYYVGTCIASECMAWRLVDRVCKHKERGTLHDTSVMNDGFSDVAEYELLPQRGYCGLAGQP